ncbi:MAG: efflux RND transporter periplasmic adaptor subunit [Planctomycetia bacterium]|nr:efflux RND transporter periplasmic adaptor subunit [Planctomycetia bacterium]
MSRLSLLFKGSLTAALILSVCSVSYAQGGGATAVSRSTVVAGVAVDTVPVTKKKYIGNVEAIEQVDCVPRVSGTLTVAEGFEEGSHVKKGQLLFEIDPIPYKAKVQAAEAAIAQTKARIAYAEANFQRLDDLYKKNAGSKDDQESALSNLQSLRAELISAEAQLILAQEDLKYTQIYAEIDGRVGRRSVSAGNYVTPATPSLARVVQMDPIYVRFTMSERDYLSMFSGFNSLKELSTVQLTMPNDTIYESTGEIAFIDNSVKSTTDTIKIWAKFSNPNEVLNPGGVVTVNLTKRDDQQAVGILPSAVMFDGKNNYVYILVDSISDEQLYQEICNDSRFKNEIKEVEDGKVTKEEFLEKFKTEHYATVDPKTKRQQMELVNGKVDEKYLLVLRRNVTLGPSTNEMNTVYNGIKVGDVIMMDGVNKARPFDLVRPIYQQDASQTATSPNAKKGGSAQSQEPTSNKEAQDGSQARSEARKVACNVSTAMTLGVEA